MAQIISGGGTPTALGERLADALAIDLGDNWAVEKYNPGDINTNTIQSVNIARCYSPDYDNSFLFQWVRTNVGAMHMYIFPYCDGRINSDGMQLEASDLNATYGIRGFKSAKGTICAGLQLFPYNKNEFSTANYTRQIIIARNANN